MWKKKTRRDITKIAIKLKVDKSISLEEALNELDN